MKKILVVTAMAVASLSLGACAITPTDATAFVNALNAAGCKGTLNVTASATTAAMGVPSASLSNTFSGSCSGSGGSLVAPAAAAATTPTA